jgi:two-component system cell cycle sensor histidine kinase/response regulator CckA
MKKISKISNENFHTQVPDRELEALTKKEDLNKFETMYKVVAGIAHDLNNILTTLSGYAEMLEDDLPETSPMLEKTIKIQDAVLKARALTNQIFTLNRQDIQEKFLVRVSEVLVETIGFVKSSIPGNINLRSRIAVKDASVFADPTQLFRVFLNLLTNAIKSMEKEGGTLSVSLNITDGYKLQQKLNKDVDAKKYVTVAIRDTGNGIDTSLISRISDPYFSTNEAGKGKGLGLPVVRGLVSDMKGEILVSGKKGKGSVFYVFLPVSGDYDRKS